MKRLLTVRQAAEILELSPNYVRGLILDGELRAKNISRGVKRIYRIDTQELDRFIDDLPED